MKESEIEFRNRKFTPIDKEELEKTLSLLRKKKSYYYNKYWKLKYIKNDRD